MLDSFFRSARTRPAESAFLGLRSSVVGDGRQQQLEIFQINPPEKYVEFHMKIEAKQKYV